jgi:hypothetical protein
VKLSTRDRGFVLLVLGMVSWIAWLAVGNVRTATAMTERHEVALRLTQHLSRPDRWPAGCLPGEQFDDCLGHLRSVLTALETAPSAQPRLFDRCDRQHPISFGAVIIDVVRPDAIGMSRSNVSTAQLVLPPGASVRVGVCGPGFLVLPVATLAGP